MGDDIFTVKIYSSSIQKSLTKGIRVKLFKYLSILAVLLLASTGAQAQATLVINASTVVPLSTAFWLFGTALIGFVGVSRRRSV